MIVCRKYNKCTCDCYDCHGALSKKDWLCDCFWQVQQVQVITMITLVESKNHLMILMIVSVSRKMSLKSSFFVAKSYILFSSKDKSQKLLFFSLSHISFFRRKISLKKPFYANTYFLCFVFADSLMFSRQVQKQQVSYEWSWWLSTSTQVQDDCCDWSKVWWKQLMIAMIAWNKYYKYSYFCYFFVSTKKACVIAMIVFKSLTSTRFSMFSWEVLKTQMILKYWFGKFQECNWFCRLLFQARE